MIDMENATKIKELLTRFPLYSEDLGIDLTKPSGRFRWFLASILYGARISEKIASNTYKAFEKAGLDCPEKIIRAGWDELVRTLDSGGYVRYDFSTATKLLNIMTDLKEKYGSLEELYDQSSDVQDLERRLQEFKGIGPVTTQIFLRELRGVWNLDQEALSQTRMTAQLLDINLDEFKGKELSRIETALVKLSLRCCKKRRSCDCPWKDFCERSRKQKEKRVVQ